MTKAVFGIFVIGKDEIQDSDCVDAFKFKIPDPFLTLILDRKGGIEYTSVLKELLLRFLHLYDERLAFFVFAIYIKDSTTVAIAIAKILTIQVSKVIDHLLALEQRVEKANQQIFIERSTKQLLKSEVCVGIDIFGASHFFYVLYASVCHIVAYLGVSFANIGIVCDICKLFGLIVFDSLGRE